MADKYLIVGLGNPGREYENTRHNIGFMAADALIKRHSLGMPRKDRKALIYEGTIAGQSVLVVKPQTYMNLSGEAVRPLLDFYKIPLSNLIVLHDEMDIPFGTLRIRQTGSAGGQNGVTLHAVRGMTIVGDTLWACDADAIRGFNRLTGEPVAEIDMTSFEPGFLNDITVGPDGELYVTDTPRNRIYRIDGRTPSIALETEALNSPNGITWDRTSGQAVVLPFGGNQVLNRWGGEAPGLEPIATGLQGGRYDGVEVLAYGRLLVSSQADSSIHVVQDGTIEATLKTVGAPADIGYDVRRNRVAVPFVALNQVQILEVPAQ